MYAIVKTGGKQYRVEEGQSLLVERLPVDDGAKAQLQPLLYVDGSNVVDGEDLSKVTIEARVLGHERGPKLRIVKFKPKRGYKRRTGHRQELTRIEVTQIKLASRRASSSRQAPKPVAAEAAAPAGESSAVAEAEKPVAARKAPKRAAADKATKPVAAVGSKGPAGDAGDEGAASPASPARDEGAAGPASPEGETPKPAPRARTRRPKAEAASEAGVAEEAGVAPEAGVAEEAGASGSSTPESPSPEAGNGS
jgi:large subunit ribosomal protein L21